MASVRNKTSYTLFSMAAKLRGFRATTKNEKDLMILNRMLEMVDEMVLMSDELSKFGLKRHKADDAQVSDH